MSYNITIKKRASKALANLPKDDYQKFEMALEN
jgi:mRNA interferase RelE/StbE